MPEALDIIALSFLELLAYDVLVELDVALSDAVDDLFCHFRNLLSFLTLETVCHEPLTNEFL